MLETESPVVFQQAPRAYSLWVFTRPRVLTPFFPKKNGTRKNHPVRSISENALAPHRTYVPPQTERPARRIHLTQATQSHTRLTTTRSLPERTPRSGPRSKASAPSGSASPSLSKKDRGFWRYP